MLTGFPIILCKYYANVLIKLGNMISSSALGDRRNDVEACVDLVRSFINKNGRLFYLAWIDGQN